MSQQRQLTIAALVVIAALAAGWILLLSPKREQVAAVQAPIAQAESRRDVATAAVTVGEQARDDSRRDARTFTRLLKAVPSDDDVGPLIKQLEAIANANKIDFRAVKLVAGAAAAPAPAAPPPAPEGTEAGDETAPSAAPVAAVVAQPPPGAVVGPAGLLTVPFSFTFDGGYAEMQRFLRAVHGLAKSNHGRITVKGRLMTIDGFSLAPGRDGFPKLKALVSATAYLMPDPAAPPAVPAQNAAPAAPGAAATPEVPE